MIMVQKRGSGYPGGVHGGDAAEAPGGRGDAPGLRLSERLLPRVPTARAQSYWGSRNFCLQLVPPALPPVPPRSRSLTFRPGAGRSLISMVHGGWRGLPGLLLCDRPRPSRL